MRRSRSPDVTTGQLLPSDRAVGQISQFGIFSITDNSFSVCVSSYECNM